MSSRRPDMKPSAVAPLIRMPMEATQITVISATGSGDSKRRTASSMMAPQAISSSMALASDARLGVRFMP